MQISRESFISDGVHKLHKLIFRLVSTALLIFSYMAFKDSL